MVRILTQALLGVGQASTKNNQIKAFASNLIYQDQTYCWFLVRALPNARWQRCSVRYHSGGYDLS